MAANIIIKDLNRLEEIKKQMQQDGVEKLHIIADFDKTLTKAFVEGQASPSAIAQIRQGNYLPEEYSRRAHELFDTYHPIEVSTELEQSYKNEKMNEWWRKHFDLLIEYKISKQILNTVVKSKSLEFRTGALEFIDTLDKHSIPLVIMSAGLGDMIVGYLEQEGRMYDNVKVVSNFFEFDQEGFVLKPTEPIIHSLNKHEVVLHSFPFYKELEHRQNVLLLGDNLDDIGMIEGFDYKNLIKIGFLNDDVEKRLEFYNKVYDVIITDDGDMSEVQKLIEELGSVKL
jgi:cytosolic 5'-nucleotidase 3